VRRARAAQAEAEITGGSTEPDIGEVIEARKPGLGRHGTTPSMDIKKAIMPKVTRAAYPEDGEGPRSGKCRDDRKRRTVNFGARLSRWWLLIVKQQF